MVSLCCSGAHGISLVNWNLYGKIFKLMAIFKPFMHVVTPKSAILMLWYIKNNLRIRFSKYFAKSLKGSC